MKTLHLPILVAALSLTTAEADPVLDFIGTLLEKPNTLTNWIGEIKIQPNGGYIFRFNFDLDGDGENELFLGSSTDIENDKACSWSVYKIDLSGNSQLIATDLIFHPVRGFYLTSQQGRPQIKSVFVKPPDFGSFNIYTLGADGKLGASTKVLTASELNTFMSDKLAEQQLGLGQLKTPTVQKILLADFLKNQQVQWRAYKADLAIVSQGSDPADASILGSAQDFMIEDAKTLLQSRQGQ